MLAIKLVLFVLVMVGAFAMSIKFKKVEKRSGDSVAIPVARPLGILTGIILIILSLVLLGSVGQISAGKRGVVLKFGAVTGRVLGEGIYAVTPFVNSVEVMEVQVQAFHAQAKAVSKDMQEVTTQVTLNYTLSPSKVNMIYQTLGRDYEERIIKPAIQESVKASTAKFTAEELVTKRADAKRTIEESIYKRLAKHALVMETVSITDFDFTKDFKNAVEKKVIAQQNYLTEKNNLEMIKQKKEQKIQMAMAEAESLRLQKQEITPELIRLRQIEVEKSAIDKWDGHLPSYVGGSGPVPIMDIFQK
jgi:regulator of protease activity HflC (stomatin/prohibitin superfamily)